MVELNRLENGESVRFFNKNVYSDEWNFQILEGESNNIIIYDITHKQVFQVNATFISQAFYRIFQWGGEAFSDWKYEIPKYGVYKELTIHNI